MRFTLILVAVVIVVFGLAKTFKKEAPKVTLVHRQVSANLAALDDWYKHNWVPALQSDNAVQIQTAFLEGRAIYKKAEWAIEYFFAASAKEMNGAPVPEIEAAEHLVFPPTGFQVIETYVFPFSKQAKDTLLQESKKWASVLFRLQTLWQGHQFRDDQVWDAARLQLLRITALGLSGFDTPLSLASISEIKSALQGVEWALQKYYSADDSFAKAFQNTFNSAYAYLDGPTDFNAFNRMHFIQQHLQPLGRHLVQVQKKLKIPFSNIHAINGYAATFFDSAAFNPNYFTPSTASWLTKEKILLGKQLFNDVILSGNGATCASCHHADKAFTDGLVKSRSFGTGAFLQRNTPTLLYAGLQQAQFYDMRAGYLEDQVKNVIDSKDELHGSLEITAQKLTADKAYVKMFQKAFNDAEDTVTEYKVQAALAAYLRSLAPFTSRFDQHMRKGNVLNGEEIKGFNLFMGKAKCGSCHFVPLFNGTMPPMFSKTESEVIGVPAEKAFERLDSDSGRYSIYAIEEWKGAFKTPALRNIALTAPYMHNGVFDTLEEVLQFYNEGGAAGLQIEIGNQSLSPEKLHLTREEIKQVILFLKTLTDVR